MTRLLLAALLLLTLPCAAMAQDDGDPREAATYRRAEQIVDVLKGMAKPDDVFSLTFLKAVPIEQLHAISEQLVSANGAAQSIDRLAYKGEGAAGFDILFEKARVSAVIQVDAEDPYLIAGFRITNVQPLGDTPDKIIADLGALPGRASIGVYALDAGGPRAILESHATEQFAIGSTFKLYVLSALVQEIKAGRRQWNNVVTLGAPSLPSGQMQNWPPGSPVTLHTLATMMISISDNTATDNLIRLLGREEIEKELAASGHSDAARASPFLTTIENFALKSGDPARIAEYAAADARGRSELLARWAPALTANDVVLARLTTDKPNAIDSIEWFASNADIARIFDRLRKSGEHSALDILSINKAMGEAQAKHWDYIGYKGGSEPGVLNLSWLLEDKQGHWFAVSASWNNPAGPVDEARLAAFLARAIGLIAPANE